MKTKEKNITLNSLLDFISEAGMLKRVYRSGWSVLGIKNAESVAEHSFRCAVVGYILACLEKVSPYKVILMTLFGDMQEARITDLHKMAQRYIDTLVVENTSFFEQVNFLPAKIKKELIRMREEYTAQESFESIVARDADILECLIQAKEYREYGYSEAVKFMKKAPRFLKTKSAKKIWRLAKNRPLNNWWFDLTEFKR
ncbi:MAG: HD domain-containing protein [Candidatus Omnitrophota bacterium]